MKFLCGAKALNPSGTTCGFYGSIDPSDLNLASIGIAELAGIQTVTRTVTNVGPSGAYTVSTTPPPGISVVVTPSSLTLTTGASTSYQVTFTTSGSATLDQWLLA